MRASRSRSTTWSPNGLAGDDREALRAYARGVQSTDTAGLSSTPVLVDALTGGIALLTLEAALPRAALHHALGTKDEGKEQVKRLIGKGLAEVGNLANYFSTSHAYLQADNGADASSYLDMVEKPTASTPRISSASPANVHNYHRFEAKLLSKLAANETVEDRAHPLLLILHTGTDWNGAFHRDSALTDLVAHPRNLTVMVEGPATLEAAGGRGGCDRRPPGPTPPHPAANAGWARGTSGDGARRCTEPDRASERRPGDRPGPQPGPDREVPARPYRPYGHRAGRPDRSQCLPNPGRRSRR